MSQHQPATNLRIKHTKVNIKTSNQTCRKIELISTMMSSTSLPSGETGSGRDMQQANTFTINLLASPQMGTSSTCDPLDKDDDDDEDDRDEAEEVDFTWEASLSRMDLTHLRLRTVRPDSTPALHCEDRKELKMEVSQSRGAHASCTSHPEGRTGATSESALPNLDWFASLHLPGSVGSRVVPHPRTGNHR